MKCYHQLTCDYLENIQTQSLTWLRERYNLSDQTELKTDLWLKIDTKDFLKKNSALITWFRELGLLPREVSATIVNTQAGAALHVDELPVTAKINIPILNYADVVNEWYSVPDHIREDYKDTNQFGNAYYDFTNLSIAECTLLDSVIPTTPIVFNSQIAHRVQPLEQARFPRVMLSVMFHNEPVNYLND